MSAYDEGGALTEAVAAAGLLTRWCFGRRNEEKRRIPMCFKRAVWQVLDDRPGYRRSGGRTWTSATRDHSLDVESRFGIPSQPAGAVGFVGGFSTTLRVAGNSGHRRSTGIADISVRTPRPCGEQVMATGGAPTSAPEFPSTASTRSSLFPPPAEKSEMAGYVDNPVPAGWQKLAGGRKVTLTLDWSGARTGARRQRDGGSRLTGARPLKGG